MSHFKLNAKINFWEKVIGITPCISTIRFFLSSQPKPLENNDGNTVGTTSLSPQIGFYDLGISFWNLGGPTATSEKKKKKRKKDGKVLKHFRWIADCSSTNNTNICSLEGSQAARSVATNDNAMLAGAVRIRKKQAWSSVDLCAMPRRRVFWPHCYGAASQQGVLLCA